MQYTGLYDSSDSTEYFINESDTTMINESLQDIIAGMSKIDLEYFAGVIIGAVGSGGGIAFAPIREAIRKSKLKKEKQDALLNNLNESDDYLDIDFNSSEIKKIQGSSKGIKSLEIDYEYEEDEMCYETTVTFDNGKTAKILFSNFAKRAAADIEDAENGDTKALKNVFKYINESTNIALINESM
jgi:hypothetical protein